ncbi:peptide ABC substrate-binding protein [Clostridia bacterium]|nr:peptide ABC substrate-binding protein [Clostridia bacterium]
MGIKMSEETTMLWHQNGRNIMKRKILSLVLAGLMVAVLFTGGSSAAAQSADVQELNLRAASFGTNFDVQDMGWRWMMAICYEGLLRDIADENGDRFELAGAEAINVSDDGLTYTFSLRKNAKWSDGEPVTANDYVYGWTRLLNPEYGYGYAPFIFNVVGAEDYYNGTGALEAVAVNALDDFTFEVKLNVPDPTFESTLVATPLYPTRQDIAEAAGDDWGKDWTLSIYNGPFSVTDIVIDNKMTWAKNPYYWNEENVKLDKVNWFAVPEIATAATMFENGQLDVFNGSGDYIAKYDKEAAAGNLKSLTIEYPGTSVLCYELVNGGLSGLTLNANIRKAIGYSINKEEMVDAVYGRYSPAYGLVSPGITVEGTSYRSLAAEPTKAEYDEYAGDSAKIRELFQKGLDELGVTTNIEDVALVLLSYGSATQDQYQREYLQRQSSK